MSMPRISTTRCCVTTPLQAQERVRTIPRCLAAVATLLLLPLAALAATVRAPAPTPTLDQVQKKMAGRSVPFEANQGQFAPEVAFAARTFAGTLFVTKDGRIVHALAGKLEQKKETKSNEKALADNDSRGDRIPRNQAPRGPGWELVESLQGARELAPVGSRPSATRVSRFAAGATPNQTSSIATFDRVRLGEAWPGVSVELAARGRNVEKLFTVAPGTNPKKIQMGVAGAGRLRLCNDGSLIATTGNGDVTFTPPVAFQDISGQRTNVPVRYQLLADNTYRFKITGAYDRSQPLVIDPLLQSTYIGGSGGEVVNALAIDASGNVLIAGTTSSTSDFPGTTGGAQPFFGGSQDAFVARLSNTLTTLMQATYLGGSTYDAGYALALDASGNVLVAGETESTNFPGTSGGAQPTNSSAGIGGGTASDAFVARLSSNLTTLVQATYLGGAGNDEAHALALDAGGDVYVAGITSAVDFPGTSGGAQPAIASGGGSDAFVARLSNNLTTLVKATYLGGSGNGFERANALAFDASGNVLVAGITPSANFPGTTGGAQPTFGGPQPMFGSGTDAFVALLSANLATLMQATYLGGAGNDAANALVLDAGGNVLVAGSTGSTNFPGTAGGSQPGSGGGSADAFVARLASNLTTVMQATYVGGSGSDGANALALDTAGNVLVAGYTSSTNFPSASGGAQPANGGGNDAFVARLSSNLTTLVQATYLGGSGTFSEQATALALDTSGNVLVAGGTDSSNFPGTIGGAQPASGGGFGTDGFVARLTSDLKVSNDPIFSSGFE